MPFILEAQVLTILLELANGLNSCNLTRNLINPYVTPISCYCFAFHFICLLCVAGAAETAGQAIDHGYFSQPQSLNWYWYLTGFVSRNHCHCLNCSSPDHFDLAGSQHLQEQQFLKGNRNTRNCSALLYLHKLIAVSTVLLICIYAYATNSSSNSSNCC
jgi:hypothetical protein